MNSYEASVIASTSDKSDNKSAEKRKRLNAKSDQAVKRVLALTEVTARILKWTIPQFADKDVETIIRDHIEGELETSAPVSAFQPPKTKKKSKRIKQLNTESSEPNEADIRFNVKCRVRLSEGTTADCFLVVDMEGQGDSSPGYSLGRRAIYYLSRLISEQLPVIGQDTKYDALSKVLSIWICFNPPEKHTNSMTKLKIVQIPMVGDSQFETSEVDMMEALFILLGPDDSDGKTELIEFLNILFSTKLDAHEKLTMLHEKFDFPIKDDITEEVSEMTKSVKEAYGFRTEEAVRRAEAEGRAEEKKENQAVLKWLLEKFGIDKVVEFIRNPDEQETYTAQFRSSPEYNHFMGM